VSDLEPDGFDREWTQALARELSNTPTTPGLSWGRYSVAQARRSADPTVHSRPPAAVAALVAIISLAILVAGGVGRFLLQPGHVPAGATHVEQQTNGARQPATPSPTTPALAPLVTARVGPYAFNWSGTPAAPQAWTPGGVNDWDLMATTDYPGDQGGSMEAAYGADCAPPPASHPVKALADSAYICSNHLMTAINGGGDAPKTYGGVFFSPAHLADFSAGASSISWQVSTLRSSATDWWDVWLTPIDQNLVAPVGTGEAPAFNGPPADAIHVRVDNGTCPGSGQPATLGTVNGTPIGTSFDVEVYSNHRSRSIDGPGSPPCLEATQGRIGPGTLSSLRLEVSQHRVKFSAAGASGPPVVYADAQVDLPFRQAVVQFAHHSLDPGRACTQSGHCGPNTYQWSNVSINPSTPFTMLRPNGIASIHGQAATLRLPQTAPAGAHLRFFAFGSIRVGFDGHPAEAAVPQRGQQPATGEASYWMSVPEGTTTISVSGSGTGGLPWWVLDVSVWAPGT
jgi:hypothetical protein